RSRAAVLEGDATAGRAAKRYDRDGEGLAVGSHPVHYDGRAVGARAQYAGCHAPRSHQYLTGDALGRHSLCRNRGAVMPTVSTDDLNRLMQRSETNGVVDASKERSRLKRATQEFEAVFVGLMLKQMRKSMANSNALFGNNNESKMYQDMTDDAIAQQISKTGSF